MPWDCELQTRPAVIQLHACDTCASRADLHEAVFQHLLYACYCADIYTTPAECIPSTISAGLCKVARCTHPSHLHVLVHDPFMVQCPLTHACCDAKRLPANLDGHVCGLASLIYNFIDVIEGVWREAKVASYKLSWQTRYGCACNQPVSNNKRERSGML